MKQPLSDVARYVIVLLGFLFIMVFIVIIVRLARKLDPKAHTLRNKAKRLLNEGMLQEEQQDEKQFNALKKSITLSITIRNILRRIMTEFSGLGQVYEKKKKFTTYDLDDFLTLKKRMDAIKTDLSEFLVTEANFITQNALKILTEYHQIVTDSANIMEEFLQRTRLSNQLSDHISDCVDDIMAKQENIGDMHQKLIQEFQQLNT